MIYEYYCKKCDAAFDKIMRLKDFTTTAKCPECGKSAKKQLSFRQASKTFEPYFDKVQNRFFRSEKDFNTYCRQKNLYKPTQSEIRAHRELYADLGSKKKEGPSHGNAS